MWGLVLCFLSWCNLSPVPVLADLIGTTEPALKLLISITMAYPIAIVYCRYIRQQHEIYRNLYFIGTGIDMAFYNFGLTLYHNAIPAAVLYITTMVVGPGKMHAIITFAFNIIYLITGYIMTESENYDITWTMPQCVLTLKLIALSFDLWDGRKIQEGLELSANNRVTALKNAPTFLELIGFIFFPPCFLVGPIFSFKRYSTFMKTENAMDTLNTNEKEGMKRLVQGIVYLVAFQLGVSIFNIKYMLSDDFSERSIFFRHLYCGLWAHFALYKYISCWLLTEASCIRLQFSINGKRRNADGQTVFIWNGCSNVKLLKFEAATKFQHYIDSFNCNTNHFAAEYIYKRLKFLGNRNLSQFFTLLFLALWHGIRSGYYITFLNEFIIIYMEKEFEALISTTELYRKAWSMSVVKYFLLALLKLYTLVFMGWSLVPFDVKVFSKWWSIYSSLWFSGFVLFLPWAIVYKPVVIYLISKFGKADHNKLVHSAPVVSSRGKVNELIKKFDG